MKNLKKIAKARNKSLTSLAVELGVSQEAISQYISGKISPKLSIIIKMSKILYFLYKFSFSLFYSFFL